MRFYDYPPSQQIRRYEPFEPNSHFHVRGNCHFEGREYPCDFEVVYTLNGEIVVVGYFGSIELCELFGIPLQDMTPFNAYVPKEERIRVDFSGIDSRSGLKVRVYEALSLQSGSVLSAWNDDRRVPVFFANSFEIEQTDRTVLYNNPPQSSSIDFKLLNVVASPNISYSDRVECKIGGSHLVYLKPVKQSENRPPSEEHSVLSIPRGSIPVGWSAEDTADIWCAAVSIATGKDIRWITKHTHTSRAITKKFKRRSNIVRNRSTYGVIVSQYDFWMDVNVSAFISAVFDTLRKRGVSVDAARDYSRIMWHFVEYRLITNRIEDQARLITTTVEELLTRWERHTGNTPIGVVTRENAELMWQSLEQSWLPSLDSTLKGLKKEQRNSIEARLKTSFLEELVRPGFGKRLKQMLERGGNDAAWINDHAKHRIDSFVKTRNTIAHEGRFPSEGTEELFKYYYDMLMVLPMLIFSIYGYRGDYADLSQAYREFYKRKQIRKTSG